MNSQRLKILAVIIMTVDHLGFIFNTIYSYNIEGTFHMMTPAFWQMRVIGRMAFPIFCFLIAEGCAHTKDIRKYIGRLAAFAVISQIPYQVFRNINLGGIDEVISRFFSFTVGNVFVTLTMGAVAVLLYAKSYEAKKWQKVLYIIGVIVVIMVTEFIGEYGSYGPLLILLVYMFRLKNETDVDIKRAGSKNLQVLLCTITTSAFYILMYNGFSYEVVGAAASGLLLLLYNRQPGNRKGKWAFYIYYPAHMLVLSAVVFFATS